MTHGGGRCAQHRREIGVAERFGEHTGEACLPVGNLPGHRKERIPPVLPVTSTEVDDESPGQPGHAQPGDGGGHGQRVVGRAVAGLVENR